jgi:hypothetical protein
MPEKMRQDLDTLCAEVERELASSGLVVFRGFNRGLESRPQVDWDVAAEPDFRLFLGCAKKLGAGIVVFSAQKLKASMLERAQDQLETADLPPDEYREFERKLRKLRGYEGFTCSLEISFDHQGVTYIFHMATTWYDEFLDMLNDLDEYAEGLPADEDEEGPMGGYYSQN